MNKEIIHTDKFTGKPVDNLTDLLPEKIGSYCEFCGTELISKCLVCGAPICCPKCCEETQKEATND